MYRGIVNSKPLVIVASGKFVFAIQISNGMTHWAYALKGAPCRVVVENDRVFVAGNNELVCLEYGTGKEIFQIHTDIAPDPTLMVDGEQIYIGAGGRVACYGPFGERNWINDLGTSSGVGFALPGLAAQIDLT